MTNDQLLVLIQQLQDQLSKLQGKRITQQDILPSVIKPQMLASTTAKAKGDLYYSDGTNFQRLAAGATGKALVISGGLPAWGNGGGATGSTGPTGATGTGATGPTGPTGAGSTQFSAYNISPSSGQTVTGTSFATLTAGTQSITLGATAHVQAFATTNLLNSGSADTYIQVTYDTGGAKTLIGAQGYAFGSNDAISVTAGGIATFLGAATYTISLQGRVSAGTGTFFQPNLSIVILPA